MSGVYDRLLDAIGGEEPSGVGPMEIADLPPAQRRVMLAVLRESAASGGVTLSALAERLGRSDDLAPILDDLAARGWLIALGEPSTQRYKVNLARRRGSQLGFGIWSVLSDRLSGDDPH